VNNYHLLLLHITIILLIFLLVNYNREFIWFLIIIELLVLLFFVFIFLIITERINIKVNPIYIAAILFALITFIELFIKISLF
jgi:hypothetical protein